MGGLEGKGGTGPEPSGEVTGALVLLAGCRTSAADVSAPLPSLRAPGAIQGREVGAPLRGVALAGEILESADLTAEYHAAEFGLGLLVSRTISKAFAVWLRGRDRGGADQRLMVRPQVSVAIAMAGLARPALAPLARH